VTALVAVTSYLPTRVSIDSLREELGISRPEMKVFGRYFGLAEVGREPDRSLADLLWSAAVQLPDLEQFAPRIRYVVHARSVPVITPYPVSPLREVCSRLGLDHVVDFAVIQHACASGLLALELLGRLLDATGDPDALGLLITGEKAFTQGARIIPRTTIMGEGSAACLVSAGGERDRMLSYAVELNRGYQDPDRVSDGLIHSQATYYELVAAIIQAAVKQAGLTLADLALVLPHNVNRISWERVCQLLEYPAERVLLENVPHTAHCFCADAFINYRTAVDSGRLTPGDHYAMVAVGTGMTFAATVFRH